MITTVQQKVARKLMEAQGYTEIKFHDTGLVTGRINGAFTTIANVEEVAFELEFGRYVIVDDYRYKSSGYHSRGEAENKAAKLSEFRCRDYRVVDLLEC